MEQAPVTPMPIEQAPIEPIQITPMPIEQAPVTPMPIEQTPIEPMQITPMPTEQAPITQMPIEQTPIEPIQITPITPANNNSFASQINTPSHTPPAPDESVTINSQGSEKINGDQQVRSKGTIERMAEEVMRSCRAITERSNIPAGDPVQANWPQQGEGMDMSQMGHGSVGVSAEQNKLSQMASEFSNAETAGEAKTESPRQMETYQIPFTS